MVSSCLSSNVPSVPKNHLIISCLDDAELSFLGAPFPVYLRIASSLSLAVLRLPTPEGLAPCSAPSFSSSKDDDELCPPAILDRHIVKLIREYTMHGIGVLVHCRGGVGRAGVVACAWVLRVGLCGFPSEGDDEDFCHPSESPNHGPIRRSTLALVERVIAVVRRRRSIKAVETYEQVRFLCEYVEWLRVRRVYSSVRVPRV